jgi:hypothetical protein
MKVIIGGTWTVALQEKWRDFFKWFLMKIQSICLIIYVETKRFKKLFFFYLLTKELQAEIK